ncbi:ferritin [Bacteroidota bacterium]
MLQEDRNKLSKKTLDFKRATDSVREELEAVQFYRERAEACSDKFLKEILIHNMNEEKEHAAMLLEWMRQNNKEFDHELKDYVFSNKKKLSKH